MTMTQNSKRGRRTAPEAERKDRIIQTRVPKDLESTLKEAAERERVSVSHLIRNVLEDTFHLVDNIVADSAQLVGTVRRDAMKLAASTRGATAKTGATTDQPAVKTEAPATLMTLDDVEAWQEVLVNKPVNCTRCSIDLGRGQKALRGLTAMPTAPSVWLCLDCLDKL